MRRSRREWVNLEAEEGFSMKFDWEKNMKDVVIGKKDVWKSRPTPLHAIEVGG